MAFGRKATRLAVSGCSGFLLNGLEGGWWWLTVAEEWNH